MSSTAAPVRRLDVSLRTSARRSITIVGKARAARSSRWFCPRHRRRASGGSPAPRRLAYFGPRGAIVRSKRAGPQTDARAGATCGAALQPTVGRGWIDVARGVFYRRPEGERETKKRKPPVPLPPELHGHLRRWKNRGQQFAVEWLGKPVSSIKKAFRAVAADAGLGIDVTPHVLRHTAATWLMQAGTDPWEAAGFLGMTVETLMSRYGHHHPDYLSGARAAFSRHRDRHRNAATEREQTSSNVKKIAESYKFRDVVHKAIRRRALRMVGSLRPRGSVCCGSPRAMSAPTTM